MRISRRVLFSTMAAGLLAMTLLSPGITPTARADHKSGHSPGGGGDDDGTTSDPPPMTFQIVWIENFRVLKVNHDADLLGEVDTADGWTYGLVYNGGNYLLDEFFVDLDVTLRFTRGFSDRADDGSVYLSGTCDTVDGIRGWLMRLTPDFDGVLVRTEFSIAQPVVGDDVTNLTSVNRNGEAVGYSRLSSTGDQAVSAIYHTTAGGSLPFEFPVLTTGHFITNSGYWVGPVYNADGSFTVKGGTPGGNLQALADDVFPWDVNDLGHFVGTKTVCQTTKKGTTCTTGNYLFDGTELKLLNVRESSVEGPFVKGMNDHDDVLFARTTLNGGWKTPNYDSGSIYFADLDREVEIDDMIDLNNTDADLALWFNSNYKSFTDITNSGMVVVTIEDNSPDSIVTFLLVPVQP